MDELPSAPLSHSRPSFVAWTSLLEEPFRLLFPLACAAGLVGVALWPLYFGGVTEFYPAASHARLMAHGFFGGFILGFLGTALPRLLGTRCLSRWELSAWLITYLGLLVAHASGRTRAGDVLFAGMICLMFIFVSLRWRQRQDLPPPGFVLVALAFACALGGTLIALLEQREELPPVWVQLRPLLQYQGFILLPVLGVGGFLLPRFWGAASRQTHPESRQPPPGWTRQMLTSLGVGILVVMTFFVEALQAPQWGHLLRLVVVAGWLFHEVPIFRRSPGGNSLTIGLQLAIVFLLGGLLVLSWTVAHRAAWLHLTLVGGLGILVLSVATRVIFGHSGQADRLLARNRWFLVSAGLMLLGMATRISGDLWPAVMISHYNYGAFIWAAGLILWAIKVLPWVFTRES